MTATPTAPAYAAVAVDGEEEGYAAVVLAAEEALRHGLALRLAHAMPVYVPVGPLLMPDTQQETGIYVFQVLASAA